MGAAQTPLAGTGVASPARVLLVIDQPVLAEVVKLALYHAHFQAEVASTAPEARGAYSR
jgi:hypothetical protein